MVLLEFPKKWRENEKKPQNLTISGAFLGGEGEIYEQNSGGGEGSLFLKCGCKQSNSAVNRSVPPDRIPNRPTPAKREPNPYGSGSLFGGEGEI